MAKPKKTGKPKALEATDAPEQTLEEFLGEMHGGTDVPQNGLPPYKWIKEQFKTKSAAIRYLINQGHEVKTIAKHLGVRYQMVRNIATNPLKRGPNEDWRKPLLDAQKLNEPDPFAVKAAEGKTKEEDSDNGDS